MATATASAAKKRKIQPPKVEKQKMLIGGKWVNSVSGKTFPTLNPSTGKVICEVAEGDKADIDLAVKAARKALESGPWSKMSAAERGRLLYRLADAVERIRKNWLGWNRSITANRYATLSLPTCRWRSSAIAITRAGPTRITARRSPSKEITSAIPSTSRLG